MKIEVGESLMLSWLRHAKNCQLVQLNWKSSANSWELYNENESMVLMGEVSEMFNHRHQLDIFKSNTYLGLLKQAEIDALGVEFNGNSIGNIYAIDVAFHENGLNYGCTDETVSRVIKKMVRTALVIYGYFNIKTGNIIFASPKINNNILIPLEQYIEELNVYMNESGFDFVFKVYANESFKEKMFNAVINLSSSVADTSELFMRSIQLCNMFGMQRYCKKISNRTFDRLDGDDELKIGLLVRTSIKKLIEENAIPTREVEKLLDTKYCKDTFNLNYPLLKKITEDIDIQFQRKENGYYRYWADEFIIHSERYFICQEWYEQNRQHFLSWFERMNHKHYNYSSDELIEKIEN